MHYANLDKSSRLQRVLSVLSDGKQHTTRAIMRNAHICAVSATVSELRRNGINIACRRDGKVWRYWIENSA